jgi:hypothetical protein
MKKATAANDSDSRAIARAIETGSDLARPMKVDFHVAAPDEAAARHIAAVAKGRSFEAGVSMDPGRGTWTCSCSRSMVLDRDALLRVQDELNELSRPFGGHADGWGTFGNRKNV